MKFSSSDIIYAHQLEQMRRFRAGIWKGGSGIAANHSGSRTRLVLKDKANGGAPIWEAYGSKGGGYTGELRYGADITSLMRRINALEASIPIRSGDIKVNADYIFVAAYLGNTGLQRANYVYLFDASTGAYVRRIGATGTGNGEFTDLKGIAISATELFCFDSTGTDDRIVVFDFNGTWQRTFDVLKAAATTIGSLDFGNIDYDGTNLVIGYYDASLSRAAVTIVSTTGTWVSLGSSTNLVSHGNPGVLKADATHYFASFNSIGASDIQRYTNAHVLANTIVSSASSFFSGVAIIGSNVYYADLSNVYSAAKTDNTAGTDTSIIALSLADGLHSAASDGTDLFIVESNSAKGYPEVKQYDTSGNLLATFTLDNVLQSEFLRYPTESLGDSVSLGTPDGGVSVPALDGINSSVVALNYITNMRDVIESIASDFIHAASGNPFNWTAADSDNLYNVVFGGGDYDWERTPGAMASDNTTYDVDINEIHAILTELESADLTAYTAEAFPVS